MTTPALLHRTDTTALDLPTHRVAPKKWTAIVVAENWQPISILDMPPQRFRNVIGSACAHLLAVAARDTWPDEITASHVQRRHTVRVVREGDK